MADAPEPRRRLDCKETENLNHRMQTDLKYYRSIGRDRGEDFPEESQREECKEKDQPPRDVFDDLILELQRLKAHTERHALSSCTCHQGCDCHVQRRDVSGRSLRDSAYGSSMSSRDIQAFQEGLYFAEAQDNTVHGDTPPETPS